MMRIESLEDLLGEAAGELIGRVGQAKYEKWLKPMSLLSASESELVLGVANTFWLEWIEERYLKDVREGLERRFGRPLQVKLAIDPELFRSMRRSQKEVMDAVARSPESGLEPGPAGSIDVDHSTAPCHGRPMPAPFVRSASLPPAAGSAVSLPSENRGGRHESRRDGSPTEKVQTLSNFVVGPSNRLAFTAANNLVESPGSAYNPFFAYGVCGIGKTHLLRGIYHGIRSRHPDRTVRYLTGEEFLNQFVTSLRSGTIGRFRERNRAPQVLVIDDIHLLGSKKKTQEEFLHTFNALVDAGHQVVLSSDCHPKGIADLQEGLTGRFCAGLLVQIAKPEFEVRLEILRRRASRARVSFSEDVMVVIAEKVRSNIRELLGAFNFLEESAIQEGRPLEPARAGALLLEALDIRNRRVGLPMIADRVGLYYSAPLEALLSASRSRSLTLARQVAMFLARKYTSRSLAEIGKFFGRRNHTSVKAAESKVEDLRKTDPAIARDIEKIIDSFEE